MTDAPITWTHIVANVLAKRFINGGMTALKDSRPPSEREIKRAIDDLIKRDEGPK